LQRHQTLSRFCSLHFPSVANAAASTTAQQQPQAGNLSATSKHLCSRAEPLHLRQPQYNVNIYIPGPSPAVCPSAWRCNDGHAYNMSTMTPPPPPPPQPQMAVMPQTLPPAPPMLQLQMPMNLAPQMQFALQPPGVPPFRPMQPPPAPGMQYFFHPQSQ
jgi:regulator of Ty1 transposition protein 103